MDPEQSRTHWSDRTGFLMSARRKLEVNLSQRFNPEEKGEEIIVVNM